MAAMNALKIETKSLRFAFQITDITFNHNGKFYLKLTIVNATGEDVGISDVMVIYGDSDDPINDYTGNTDEIVQLNKEEFYKFRNNKFTFILPKGFCKNDMKHDIVLLIEAYVEDEDDKEFKKAGEGKFAIYPRPNEPKINVYAKKGEDYYNYSGIMTLFRTLEKEPITMHCGRLKYTVTLCEADPSASPTPRTPLPEPEPEPQRQPTPKEPTPPPPKERTPTPPPPPPPEKKTPPPQVTKPARQLPEDDRLFIPSPTPPPGAGHRITDSPLPEVTNRQVGAQTGMHVSRPGKDELEIIVHGCTSLPSLPDGRIPIPYAIGKSGSDEENDKPAQASTHTAILPTHSPSWEEIMTVEVEDHNAKKDALILKVADNPSKELLVNYKIPIANLIPFHQYHFEFIQPEKYGSVSGIRMYATVMRKRSVLPRDPNFVFTGLEVYLRAVQHELGNPIGPLIAVARVVPDYFGYKRDMLLRNPRPAGIDLISVEFPDPHPSAFKIQPARRQGYPQITVPGIPSEQPVWNHMFFFHQSRDNATMFSETAALVIEYYPSTNTFTELSWHLHNPIGFSVLLLDKKVYEGLMSDSGRMGIRIDGLPIQGSNLKTRDLRTPTVGMILRLITSERPDSLGAVSNPDLLPTLDNIPLDLSPVPTPRELTPPPSTPPPQPLAPAEPVWMLARKHKPKLPINDGKLPPRDAMEHVLPEYQYIFTQSPRRLKETPPPMKTRGDLITTRLPPPYLTKPQQPPPPQPPPEDETSQFLAIPKGPYNEEHALGLLDFQMKELDNYREAMKKMGKDILQLREEIARLEGENSQLRRQLNMHDDSTKAMLYSAEIDSLNRAELMERFLLLRRQLMNQTGEAINYKDKLQKLQNDIIKKNDREKDYLKLQDAHLAQSAMLQKLQDKKEKMKKLEGTITEQEKVIEKLEKLLNDKIKSGQMAADKKSEAYATLNADNARLRAELDYLKANPLNKASALDEAERMELYAKLDRAEGRIMSLEKQLESNARRWGKEKEGLLIRMNEQNKGFGRSSPIYLRDSYRAHDDDYLRGRKHRHSKLEPLY